MKKASFVVCIVEIEESCLVLDRYLSYRMKDNVD